MTGLARRIVIFKDTKSGTGVGLALVKKSLERSGGKISLESEPAKGSRFCVQLPLAN